MFHRKFNKSKQKMFNFYCHMLFKSKNRVRHRRKKEKQNSQKGTNRQKTEKQGKNRQACRKKQKRMCNCK